MWKKKLLYFEMCRLTQSPGMKMLKYPFSMNFDIPPNGLNERFIRWQFFFQRRRMCFILIF